MPRLTNSDLRRCRIFLSRPDLCTKEATLEWCEALIDEVEICRYAGDFGRIAGVVDKLRADVGLGPKEAPSE